MRLYSRFQRKPQSVLIDSPYSGRLRPGNSKMFPILFILFMFLYCSKIKRKHLAGKLRRPQMNRKKNHIIRSLGGWLNAVRRLTVEENEFRFEKVQ